MTNLLALRNLTVRYGSHTVVQDVHVSLESGQWLMLVGPNGAGKSTVLNAISQSVAYTGEVLVGGVDARSIRPQALARQVGVLMQNNAPSYGFTVEEVVSLGRYAHRRGAFTGGEDDAAAVQRALCAVGMEQRSAQSVLALSGGELQRTFLAQVLAQDPKILLLDEPTNHLDLAYQKQTFALIRDWLKLPGRAAVSVVHDLSLARAFGTHALLLHEGKQIGLGPISEVLTREQLQRVYAIDVYAWMQTMLSQWEPGS